MFKPVKHLSPIATDIRSSGSALNGIKAVVFDIYGTLLISGSGDVGTVIEAGSAAAFKKALEKTGLEYIEADTAEAVKSVFFKLISDVHRKKKTEGIPWPEVDIIAIWKDLLDSRELNALVPGICRIAPELAAAAYESVANPVSPMPGAELIIRRLAAAGIRLGIISNAQFYTPIIFELHFGSGFSGLGFDPSLCFFSYEEERSKPDTFLFQKLTSSLSEYNIMPEETIFIGNDMLKDIMPASVSGYRTALFAGDKRSLKLRSDHDACRNIKPDVILNRLTDLSDYIKEG